MRRGSAIFLGGPAETQRRVVVFETADVMTGGADFHKSYFHKRESGRRMDVDMDSSNVESELNNSIPAACSSNGSGGEEDEAEAIGRGRESGGSSSKRSLEGGVLCGGREQEVSVDIGETYLCQRADKTWRE